MLLLLLFTVLVHGQQPPVKLGVPVLVADEQGLRIDLQLGDRSLRGRVKSVVACSSIDEPFFAIDWSRRNETGCNSPGFRAETVFTEQMAYERGSLASKFAVRQTGLALYVRRRLIDRHAAVVYLEVTIHVQNALGETIQNPTLVSRFAVPERAVRLVLPGETEQPASSSVKSPQQGVIEAQIAHYLIGTDSGFDNEREDPVSKSMTEKESYWHGVHWMSVLGLGVCTLFVCICFGALISMVITNLRNRRLRNQRYHGDYALQRLVSSGNSIRDLFTHATFQGLVGGVGGGGVCGKDPRYMV